MRKVESNSVALVVTSPPYFAGKEYEQTPGAERRPGHVLRVPGSPPWRLRGVQTGARARWADRRQRGQSGSAPLPVIGRRRHPDPPGPRAAAAGRSHLVEGPGRRWFMRLGDLPATEQPVLRDVTERIVIASKGRFDRALNAGPAAGPGLPSRGRSPVTSFWRRPPTCGRFRRRAPPGSGTPPRSPSSSPSASSSSTPTRGPRPGSVHGLGFDRRRRPPHQPALHRLRHRPRVRRAGPRTGSPSSRERLAQPTDLATRPGPALRRPTHGRRTRTHRRSPSPRDGWPRTSPGSSRECGFADIRAGVKPPGLGVELSFVATDLTGGDWAFDVSGAFTSNRTGLRVRTHCGRRSARPRSCTRRTRTCRSSC